MIHQLDTRAADFDARLTALLAHDPGQDESIERTVADILRAVRQRGDEAVLEYTRRFDRLDVGDAHALELPAADAAGRAGRLPAVQRDALEAAAQRVRAYHEHQRAQSWSYTEADGTRLGQKITGLDRVGLYVPGGKAAYPSSVLMNALPAKVAGVPELIMVVPTPDGVRNAMVLAAACIAGVDRVFTIGGAQAVGALAYGTATVPAVDKIVGPGNAYVAEAKRRVFGTVGIDMIAGPSEILVLCDGHAPIPTGSPWTCSRRPSTTRLAQAILLSPDADFLERVRASIARLLPQMPRQAVIARSLADRGALILVRSLDEACELATASRPSISRSPPATRSTWADRSATPVRCSSGRIRPNRWATTVPARTTCCPRCAPPDSLRRWVSTTSRSARASSKCRPLAPRLLGRIASVLAHGEGLQAHARSAEFRLDPA
jgi:histidinol dehydrogenase